MSNDQTCSNLPVTRPQWREALASLPENPARIPAFFFAHGQPMLIWPKSASAPGGTFGQLFKTQGPTGVLAQFLQDFGKTLLDKYKPRAILVFSAHWDKTGEMLVTDYGNENPLLMDFFGFPDELYKTTFKSRGDTEFSKEVVQELKSAGIPSRLSPRTESRGHDGRGFSGPGFDHGVFVPFVHMFGNTFTDIPIVQASIDGSMDFDKEWKLGEAVSKLRSRGVLVLSGGLTYHNLRDFEGFVQAKGHYLGFHNAILEALQVKQPTERKEALRALTRHPGFRPSHPREDHFVPLYVAAGAGHADEDTSAKVIWAEYGMVSAAFDV